MTPSSVVRKAISKGGKSTFTYIHNQPETLPWRCLVKCPNVLNQAGKPHNIWSSLLSGRYMELPIALTKFIKDAGQVSIEQERALFNHGSELRPKWIGVVDVESEGLIR